MISGVAVLTGPVIQQAYIGSRHLRTTATPKSPIVVREGEHEEADEGKF